MLWKITGIGVVPIVIGAFSPVRADRADRTALTLASGSPVAPAVRLTRLKLSTGVELQVAESGPADGRPVLFLHGYTDSWYSFSPILDRLSPDIHAIVPTHRGHGESDKPACCYRIEDFAGDAVALLDALGVERASVVGHSMGSFVALRIAIDHRDRVDRLVLVGSGPTGNNAPIREFAEAVRTLPDTVPFEFRREFQRSTAVEPLPEAFLLRVVEESGKLPGGLWRDAMAGILAFDVTEELHRIRASTLIVWGEQDGILLRADQEALLRGIPNSRLIAYPDMAHCPNWEQPARFAEDLNEFLNEGSPAPGSSGSPENRASAAHASHGGSPTAGVMPLLEGLGDWRHPVTTTSAEARRYFDQGLRLTYAFNHADAVRSFERAVQLDPACGLCWWGIAYALGPNINLPMDPSVEPRAIAAVAMASTLLPRSTPIERAWIEALAARHGEPAGAMRAARDSAYAEAMRTVAAQFPEDADTQVLFADAMLNLSPWNQWTRDGRPQPGTLELVDVLQSVIARAPDHAGACHFYVHAVEASATPERALDCARRLPGLMPGAGHVVHMPAHVYLRIGRYEDAAKANIAAVEADHRYFAEHEPAPGMYPLFYAPHNLHFLWATYLLSGQRAKALDAARALVARVAIDDARENAALEGFLPAVVLTFTRFRDWDAILAEPEPPAELAYVKGMWHYARGLALAGSRNERSARVELDSVRAIAARASEDRIIILNPAPRLLDLAAEVLAGDISAGQKWYDDAIAHLRSAVRLEDALTYDEPPPWYHSARNRLGEVLLDAGRAGEAESVFRNDLWFVRETGWSLSGLERALRAQNKDDEAADVRRRFEEAWRYADVRASSARQ